LEEIKQKSPKRGFLFWWYNVYMKKAILFVVLIVLIIASGIFLKNKKVIAPTEEIKVLPVVEEKIEGRNCFVYKHEATKDEPYKVSETIDINVSGSVVTGTKKGTQAGPDMTNGYEGSLKGTLDKDVMNVVFSYVVEGSANKEKEIYLVKKDILEKLRYPLIEGKNMLIPDTTKEYKTLDYIRVDCVI
jgi:hypothetical protein